MTVSIREAVGGKPVVAMMTVAAAGPMSTPQGARKAGFSAPNRPEDVRAIQGLLNLVGATPRPLPVNGQCDKALVDAITSIQSVLGVRKPDGQIDTAHGNNTLVRLNKLAEPLTFQTLEAKSVLRGGYTIRYSGEQPPDTYRILLTVTGNAGPQFRAGQRVPHTQLGDFMEVTKAPGTDLIDTGNLAEFLAIMGRRDLWGKQGQVYLVVLRDQAVVSISAARNLDCPVKPWKKALTPTAIGAGDDGPKLKYVGEGNNGSVFVVGKINDAYFWKRDTKFATKASDRGFDCITFVGSLYQKEAGAPYASSAAMAGACDAQAVEWTNPDGDNIAGGQAKGKVIKEFFEVAAHTGTYLLWHGAHIVLVVNKTVHEFSQSKGKYNTENANDWMSDNQSYHLYSLPANKQF